MTKRTRQRVVGVMATGLLGAGGPAGAADAGARGMARVRSSNPAITALVQHATERSETFRRIVEIIDASDGIVYVEEGQCRHGARACFTSVTAAGRNRILSVKVDTRNADRDLMGSIGHELRHTIEVLGNPKVVDNESMLFFYTRIGSRRPGRVFETIAAVEAGNAVRDELRKHARTNPLPSHY
jgi:hypothetical protein